jgi:hypothetical protein
LRKNSLLKGVVEGKIKVTGRRRIRCKQLLGDLKEKESYWNLRRITGSPSLEYSLCKKLRTSRKVNNVVAVVVMHAGTYTGGA